MFQSRIIASGICSIQIFKASALLLTTEACNPKLSSNDSIIMQVVLQSSKTSTVAI